ncbi:hypothetical protein A4X09_0g564 [Tilletia walkeri]|uniref:Protein ARV n=1 Tax=Tilletia walkeri TaxID=117179 RepID=A0A8X7NEL3_9BASI|nr:hypothetical protein A4X09_0g564 [Tilletia walkeri]
MLTFHFTLQDIGTQDDPVGRTNARTMNCVCVQCGTAQPHLYVRYAHGGVLSAPCETCSRDPPRPTVTYADQGAGAGAGPTTASTTIKRAADPYVENNGVVVFLDLILVKPRAFRHLLFNRPLLQHSNDQIYARRKVIGEKGKKREVDSVQYLPDVKLSPQMAWMRAIRSFVALQLVDAFLRWYYLCTYDSAKYTRADIAVHPLLAPWLGYDISLRSVLSSYSVVFGAVVAEAVVFHASVTLLMNSYVTLRRRLTKSRTAALTSLDLFKPHLVVNALLLANVSASFLLSLILLWEARYRQPGTDMPVFVQDHTSTNVRAVLDLLAYRLRTWQPDTIIRHLVTGLSSGVALAVVLPRAPFITTTSILAGWALAAAVRTQTLLPSHSGEGTTRTIEVSYFCPSWPQ